MDRFWVCCEICHSRTWHVATWSNFLRPPSVSELKRPGSKPLSPRRAWRWLKPSDVNSGKPDRGELKRRYSLPNQAAGPPLGLPRRVETPLLPAQLIQIRQRVSFSVRLTLPPGSRRGSAAGIIATEIPVRRARSASADPEERTGQSFGEMP
jgi:hypothetical protein